MKLADYLNPEYLEPKDLAEGYAEALPFPHIVLEDFVSKELVRRVAGEFPDLSQLESRIEFKNQRERKFASDGFQSLSPAAASLISFFNSDVFLRYLQDLTGIQEILISDPYLSGGGYHEIKKEGVLKVHADFNKHPLLNLDRRLNLLLYLNDGWDSDWGGALELYDESDLSRAQKSIQPSFNKCVIFTTTSHTYHGHPQPLNCPQDISRKSIALYYFSTGRPDGEALGEHGTLFRPVKGEKPGYDFSGIWFDIIPPVLFRTLKRIYRRFSK